MASVSRRLNFDPLARPYRWLEYATFGVALERCRFYFLPELAHARRALVLGDGDGRFLARLLMINPRLQADVVDISPAMLKHLQKKLDPQARKRITTHQADARQFPIPDHTYDLVVTHFFLDCLTAEEIAALTRRIAPHLESNASWIVSEFAIPRGKLPSLLGKFLVSALYRAFGWMTGLPVRELPEHGGVLIRSNFVLEEDKPWLQGLLRSQRWHYVTEPVRQPVAE
jgi:SAM-dependent methyltransferase